MRLLSLFALFLSLALLARIALLNSGYVSGWEAWFADVVSALLLALICSRLHWSVALVLWVLWAIVYLGNLAFLQAMGSAVDYRDLGYLVDPQFLQATLADQLWLIVIATPLALLAAAYLVRFCWRQRGPPWSVTSHAMLIGSCLLLLLVQASATRLPQWSNMGLVPLHVAELLADLSATDTFVAGGDFDEPEETPGHSRFALGAAKNVLLLVIEGVHGAYLPQVAAANDEKLPVSMVHAGQWAERGWLVPDFLVHARQTNRGLYAMLCGDYPRLDGGHPKAMQILNVDAAAEQCLPHILSRAGFNTAYFQAADLQFMSKHLVMPQLGFAQLVGKEGFTESRVKWDTGFSWGPDDDTFFQQTVPRLQALQAQDKPFFATLLTVGTHYPYAVTAQQIEKYGDPRAAAVVAADVALDNFLQRLRELGLLEDTLVIVTNDESHGIPGHWLGQNWGLLFALAPDLAAGQTDEIFSSIDIANSILDYLGLFPAQRTHLGRSVFRQHDDSRSFMLASSTLKMVDTDGLVHSCTRRVARDGSNLAKECVTMQSTSGRLFERNYESLNEDFDDRYQFFWQRLLHSLYRFRDSSDWHVLVAEENHDLAAAGDILAIAHHRVSLPQDSLLTVDFEIAYSSDNDHDLVQLEWAQYGVDGMAGTLPKLVLPTLSPGDSVRVRYVVPHYGDAVDVELLLKRVAALASGALYLRNYRYALQPQEGGVAYLPRVHIESAVPALAAARFSFESSESGPGTMQPLAAGSSGHTADVFFSLGDLAEYADQSCTRRQFSNLEQRIIQAYLVYYNRPADPAGLAYWTQRVLDYRYDEDAYQIVIQAFSESDEYTRYFSKLDTEQLVERLFQQLFDQRAQPESLRSYSDAVKAGKLSRERVAMDIVQSADASQQIILDNRLLVSQFYTTAAEALPELQVDAPFLSQLITDVDADRQSLSQACARIHQLLAIAQEQ